MKKSWKLTLSALCLLALLVCMLTVAAFAEHTEFVEETVTYSEPAPVYEEPAPAPAEEEPAPKKFPLWKRR